MTNTLPDLLAKLAEVAPEVCQLGKFKRYEIDNYRFGIGINGELYVIVANNIVSGQPALDWLQGALQRVCESKGWDCQLGTWGGVNVAEVWTDETCVQRSGEFAFLEALIAALQDNK